MNLPEIDIEKTEAAICNFIVSTVKKHHKNGVILGLSGGIDSALVAVLTKKAFVGTSLECWCYYLPEDNNPGKDIDWSHCLKLSDMIEEEFENSLKLEYHPIRNVTFEFDRLIEKDSLLFLSEFDRGNMVSRIRANILHTYAAIKNALVIGTGNHDEDYVLGYYTLFGDGAVHFSPLGSLSKRHVVQVAKSYKKFPKEIIEKDPSARLENGQTDFNDLGYTYLFAERVNELVPNDSKEEIKACYDDKDIVKMFETFSKFKNVSDAVNDVLSRRVGAREKAKLICPVIGPRILK